MVFDPAVLVLQLGMLLGSAYLLGRAAERVGLPAATGEIVAGVALGPSVLGHLFDNGDEGWLFATAGGPSEGLRAIGLFCSLLLVGLVGTTLDLGLLRTRSRAALAVSVGSLLLPLVVTMAVALLVDERLRGPAASQPAFIVFAGLVLSVSAVPVIAKILADLEILHRDVSQLSLSVAVIDDAVVWVGLSVLAAGAHGRQTLLPSQDIVVIALVLGLVLIVARRAARRSGSAVKSMPRVLPAGSWCLLAAGLILLGGALATAAGLDSTLGAFLAGVLLARGRLLPDRMLAPLRLVTLGLLAPLFLAISGLTADFTALADPWLAATALAAVVLATATKLGGAYLGARVAKLSNCESLAIGAALNARGTVQLVVGAAGLRLGLISAEAFTVVVLVSLVTSAMAGPLLRLSMRRLAETDEERARRSRSA